MPSRPDYLASMQHHNTLLATLCQHMDIKASIFLSFVGVVLVAHALGTAGSPTVFVLALAFAVVYPIRMGAKMLASRPAAIGGATINWKELFDMNDETHAIAQRKLVQSYDDAIRHNSGLLRQKIRENKNIIITSLLLFGYIMVMTIVAKFIESPGASLFLP